MTDRILTITPEQIMAVQQPLSQAYTLPPQAYTSPEIYALEKQKIFRKNWICVGRAEEIPNPGDYFSLELFGEPLLVIRDFNSNIQVLSNVCSHRYATLVEGSGNRKSLLCPYHNWNYSLTGELIAAPGMERTEGFEKGDVCLPKLRSEIWEGFIFINCDRNAQPLSPQLATLSQLVANYNLSEMRILEKLSYDFHFNWKLIVENFSETYHHNSVHRHTLGLLSPTEATLDMESNGPYNICRVVGKAYDSENKLPPIDSLKDWQCTDALQFWIYPFLGVGIFPDRLTFIQVIPITVDSIQVHYNYCMPAANFSNPEYVDALQKTVRELSTKINQEDQVVNEKAWKGLQSCWSRSGRLSHFEKTIWEFNQWWLSQMMS